MGNSETITFPSNAPVTIPTNPPVPPPTNAPVSGPTISVNIIIKTDNYPQETSFKITNQDGIEFLSGGGYTAALTLYTASVSLPNSNVYYFTIYDSAGDGLCCAYGSGGYNLFVNSAIVKAGGVFTTSETITLPTSFDTSRLYDKKYLKPSFVKPKYEKEEVDNLNSITKDTKRNRNEHVVDGEER